MIRSTAVEDFEHPSSKRALAAFQTGDAASLLYRYARRRTGSEADATDLVADALACVCDPVDGRPWDPDRGSFFAHMRIVIDDTARRQRRSARARREVVGDNLARDEAHVDGAPRSDDALAEQRRVVRLRRLGGVLRARLSGLPLAVFDRTCDGTEDAGAIAGELGTTVAEVYRARESIAYHAKAVLAAEHAEEEARMRALRERDHAKKTEAP
jgi:Sigma-70 region 2